MCNLLSINICIHQGNHYCTQDNEHMYHPKVSLCLVTLPSYLCIHSLAYVLAKSLQLCLTLWDSVECSLPLSPLSMEFSRQEYWSGLPCPPSGDLPSPGIKLASLKSPALASGFLITSAAWAPSYPLPGSH